MNLPVIDLVTGGGSFLLSSLIGFVSKTINSGTQKHTELMDVMKIMGVGPKSEEDKKRDYDLHMRQLQLGERQERRAYEDVSNARKMQGRFVGITRRGLAWSTLFLFGMLGLMAIISVFKGVPAVSIPTQYHHSILFGLISWSGTRIQELNGLVWMPWISTWFFMIGGFYFGREQVK